ncbi:MAG TPA: hypothetical protein VGG40_07510 [Solirubrobacterales bacterium]|jgi:hypothetical protein
MFSKLKTISLTLVAIFALAAIAASAASAAEYHAEEASEAKPAFLFGESSDTVLTIKHSPTNVTVACASTKLAGSSTVKAAVTMKLHPTYSSCKLNGVAATITVPSTCGYELGVAKDEGLIEFPANSGKFQTFWKASAAVASCGSPIKIAAGSCTVEVKNQSGLQSVSTLDQGSGTSRDIFMIIQLSGIKVSQKAGCPGEAGEFTTGEYSETMTLKGFTNELMTTQQGIWVE